MIFAEKFNILIEILNIKSKDMADTLDINITMLSKWRNGKRKISYSSDNFDALCKYFSEVTASQDGNHTIKSVFRLDSDVNLASYDEWLSFYKNWFSDDNASFTDLYEMASCHNQIQLRPSSELLDNELRNSSQPVKLYEGIAGICSAYHDLMAAIPAEQHSHVRMIIDKKMMQSLKGLETHYGYSLYDAIVKTVSTVLSAGHKFSWLTDSLDDIKHPNNSEDGTELSHKCNFSEEPNGDFHIYLYPHEFQYPSYYCLIVDDTAIAYGVMIDSYVDTPIISVSTSQANIINGFTKYFDDMAAQSQHITVCDK